MSYKYKLQLIVIPLIILPIIAITLIFNNITSQNIEDLQRSLLELKLQYLINQSADEHKTLEKGHLKSITYYLKHSQQKIIAKVRDLEVPGGYVFVMTGKGKHVSNYYEHNDLLNPDSFSSLKFIKEISLKKNGSLNYISKLRNEKEKEYLTVYNYYKEWDWIFVGVVDKKIIYKGIQEARKFSFLVMIVSIIYAATVLVILSGNISNAIITLKNATAKIGKGDLSTRVTINSGDEFGDLGDNINAMALQLESSFKESEQKSLEKERLSLELRQSQKMEAIGTLAGGIAHDFNNILTAIIGYNELCRIKIDDTKRLVDYHDGVKKGAIRARDLVSQILTFCRRSEQKKQLLMLTPVVKEVLKLLRSSIPANIHIEQQIGISSKIMADPVQIHQVVMNLCTNSYHAMRESGGTLTVCLWDVELTENDFSTKFRVEPGKYVRIEVTDTGKGIGTDILEKIFDPYFTTKPQGEGTGLGLSVVHGIVNSYNGGINISSKPGGGASFIVYFPVVREDLKEDLSLPENIDIGSGNEQIMVVDDEKTITSIAEQFLSNFGYKVDVFNDGDEALKRFKKQPDFYDLIITDMAMPNMDGASLARKILSLKPELPVVLCTGFSESINSELAAEIGIKLFVLKPISYPDLLGEIRRILDSR
jgi:signal transduction histidine kinase/CheY-like chemotaxis protein